MGWSAGRGPFPCTHLGVHPCHVGVYDAAGVSQCSPVLCLSILYTTNNMLSLHVSRHCYPVAS